MKRFLLTSPSFTGSAELVYDEQGVLTTVDVRNTNMSADARGWLFSKASRHESQLPAFVAGLKAATLVQEDYVVTLDDFNREYPFKRNTHLLPDIWRKMNTVQQLQAWQAAREYRRYCERNSNWYKPKIAAAWLKAKEYLNDWKSL